MTKIKTGVIIIYKKNKTAVIFLITLLVTLIITGAVLIFNKNSEIDSDYPNNSFSSGFSEISSYTLSSEDNYYVIKTFGTGKIGVFYNDSQKPSIILNEIILYTLPKFDQELLKNGIKVYSDEELYALIEDLDS